MDQIEKLPIFRISGGSGRRRRDYIMALTKALEKRSLSVLDLLSGPAGSSSAAPSTLVAQARRHDVVFIESESEHPENTEHTLQLSPLSYRNHNWREGQKKQDSGVFQVDRNLAIEVEKLVAKLDQLVAETPVWACILIGGKSSRMGQAKHLIKDKNGRTWLERTAELLGPLVDGLVVSGAGLLPENLGSVERIDDIPGVLGPLTGIVAASRWKSTVSWLFIACDMPFITGESVRWLLSNRKAGRWGRVPRLADSKYCEPLFAWYDFRAGHLFEQQLVEGNLRIGAVAKHPKIENPLIPGKLASGWKNINTPEQLKAETES